MNPITPSAEEFISSTPNIGAEKKKSNSVLKNIIEIKYRGKNTIITSLLTACMLCYITYSKQTLARATLWQELQSRTSECRAGSRCRCGPGPHFGMLHKGGSRRSRLGQIAGQSVRFPGLDQLIGHFITTRISELKIGQDS